MAVSFGPKTRGSRSSGTPFANASRAFALLIRMIERPSDWPVTEANPEEALRRSLSNTLGNRLRVAASHRPGPAHRVCT